MGTYQTSSPFYGVNLRIKNDAGNIRYSFSISGVGSMEPIVTIPVGEWIHIVCGRGPVSGNPLGFFIYQNGVEISTFNNTQNVTSFSAPFNIGRILSSYFDGDIAQVRVYKNKSLSKSDINFNIDAMRGRYEIKPLLFSGVSYSVT